MNVLLEQILAIFLRQFGLFPKWQNCGLLRSRFRPLFSISRNGLRTFLPSFFHGPYSNTHNVGVLLLLAFFVSMKPIAIYQKKSWPGSFCWRDLANKYTFHTYQKSKVRGLQCANICLSLLLPSWGIRKYNKLVGNFQITHDAKVTFGPSSC